MKISIEDLIEFNLFDLILFNNEENKFKKNLINSEFI